MIGAVFGGWVPERSLFSIGMSCPLRSWEVAIGAVVGTLEGLD